jgi:hypothetical protein
VQNTKLKQKNQKVPEFCLQTVKGGFELVLFLAFWWFLVMLPIFKLCDVFLNALEIFFEVTVVERIGVFIDPLRELTTA